MMSDFVIFLALSSLFSSASSQIRSDERIFKNELFLSDGDLNSGLYEGMVRGRRLFGSSQIPHGLGTINYFTNDVFGRRNYTGEWVSGMRSGNGTTHFRDGSYYTGQYKNGVENGEGTIRYENGNTLRGEFRDGKIHGHVVFNYPNGDQREGFFEKNILNGQVIYTKANGDTRVEIWVNGVRQNEGAVQPARNVFTTQRPSNGILESNDIEESFPSSNTFTSSAVDERREPFRLPRIESSRGSTRQIKALMQNLRRLVKEDERNFLFAIFREVS